MARSYRFITLTALILTTFPNARAQQGFPMFISSAENVVVTPQTDVLSEGEHRSRLALLHTDIVLSAPLLLNLFDDATYTVTLERQQGQFLSGLEVWKGRVEDSRFDHLPHYRNTVVVLNRKTGRFVANIETDRGFFQILPAGGEGEYRIRDCKTFTNEMCRFLENERANRVNTQDGHRAGCDSECDETDEEGLYVIDLFAGYSTEAATVAGDLEAHAQANVETVNMGFTNSMVVNTYMRLVGTGVTPNNPGIIPDVLSDAWDWFAEQIEELAPDFVAVFQTPTDAPDSAGGWGYMPGRSSVNGVAWASVFRHEFGHNVGGAHCFPDNESHFNGFNNGNWRTHLCGNDVNFYSTPLLNDNLGTPIGDSDEADMVRAITETAAQMAAYAMHRVPYFDGDECLNLICLPQHWGDPIEHIVRVQFNTIDNQQANPDWNCASVTGYSDYTDISTDVTQGSTYQVTVTPDFSWAESTLDVWVDWNGNGLFTPDERMVAMTGNGPWSAAITVPTDAVPGPVRMRIRLLYGLEQETGPCDGSWYSSGETEDYTVNIIELLPTGIVNMQDMRLRAVPNPTSGIVALHLDGPVEDQWNIRLLNVLGQEVFSQQKKMGDDGLMRMDLTGLPGGVYLCEVLSGKSGRRTIRLVRE
jgi:hypothetical protein